jgi:hypothetical protein
MIVAIDIGEIQYVVGDVTLDDGERCPFDKRQPGDFPGCSVI